MLAHFVATVFSDTNLPSPTQDPVGSLLAYGPLGIGFFLFVTGIITRGKNLDRALDERDEALTYARTLEKDQREKTVPLLTTINLALIENQKVTARVLDRLDHPAPRRRSSE